VSRPSTSGFMSIHNGIFGANSSSPTDVIFDAVGFVL
jgi:hypothetical protein